MIEQNLYIYIYYLFIYLKKSASFDMPLRSMASGATLPSSTRQALCLIRGRRHRRVWVEMQPQLVRVIWGTGADSTPGPALGREGAVQG